MTTRRCLHFTRILPLLVIALAMLLVAPMGAAAASPDSAGPDIQVAIPGAVSLIAYLTAGLLLVGLAVARHRPTV